MPRSEVATSSPQLHLIKNGSSFLFVQIATVTVFLGRAWQHLYWDAPYRALLWDEQWMRPVLEGVLGWNWQTYVTNLANDAIIQKSIQGIGILYLLAAIAAAGIHRWGRPAIVLLHIGAYGLVFLAFLYMKERFFHLGQFLEYALQFGSPFLLIAIYQKQELTHQLIFWAKIAIALTFVCHGLYAMGYYPRPGEFTSMTMAILHVQEATAVQFLLVMGILDCVAVVMLFLPNQMVQQLGLWYCVAWGLATTLARVWAHWYPAIWTSVLLQWLHESLYRFPHFLIPLALLTTMRNRK